MMGFEPGELFVYTRDGDCKHMELGQVKRKVDDDTYACWYSTGDTAARTHVRNMRKLANAGFSHIERGRWDAPWYRITACEVECMGCGMVTDLDLAEEYDSCPRCGRR